MAMTMDHGALEAMRPDGWLVQVVLRQDANDVEHVFEESIVTLVGSEPISRRMSARGWVLTFYFDHYAAGRAAYDTASPTPKGIASISLLRVSDYFALGGHIEP